MNIRISQEDFVLKLEGDQGVGLRKGDWIALYPQILHMDPEVYEDPKVNTQLVLLFPLQAGCSGQAYCDLWAWCACRGVEFWLGFFNAVPSCGTNLPAFRCIFQGPVGQRIHGLKREIW